ncbi:hydroxyisourate hydrolase [Phycisphaera mikurensis]|uniref:5-hydroxyisourate hydrolase n=1 Tax=Phycisphaera mikurensis (strain NBRC 102666 / KCTC 22515 / FYK2301M01) TaxID=1142394 RepID=I0IIX6_PHYMF|nr:hydroxyisourate hydrolase [Phycisphaera mikurensis]MBB6443401.1 5-hydroxyisourate hydrolase [Phycisphaera mikurensis]BAM05214.1 5-hydroxyisourate hydrolase [Phycisphaera mikurensis NBRC 102666]
MSLSTHVLDTALGVPAAGMSLRLRDADGAVLAEGTTNADGRYGELPAVGAGVFVLRFETAAYFALSGRPCFYPSVEVRFEVTDPASHHHVPLLVSPFGFSSYRGS